LKITYKPSVIARQTAVGKPVHLNGLKRAPSTFSIVREDLFIREKKGHEQRRRRPACGMTGSVWRRRRAKKEALVGAQLQRRKNVPVDVFVIRQTALILDKPSKRHIADIGIGELCSGPAFQDG